MITIKNRETRQNMIEYAVINWNSGHRLSEDEEKDALLAYMYEDAAASYIEILMSDVFESFRDENKDLAAANMYKDIIKHATKEGKKALIAAAAVAYKENEDSYKETIAAAMNKAAANLEYIDG